MECSCYVFGDAALHLNPCPVHERWAKAVKAVAVHDEREACAEVAEADTSFDMLQDFGMQSHSAQLRKNIADAIRDRFKL